ncbi:DEAD/DEAH box helicase [Kribbella deserti]|uniref:DEAD/DEAH box helicase n=1 Tax=Kribbella deserti TaxID=1926257 RepID=A0ABV6QHW9_9ACTN
MPKVDFDQRVYLASADRPLPWQAGHPIQRIRLREKQQWRHTVFLGLFPLTAVFEVLQTAFPAAEHAFDERPNGESALAAFLVGPDGRPALDSAILSSCAWATGRSRSPGPSQRGWLDGFEEVQAKFSEHLAELWSVSGEEDVDAPVPAVVEPLDFEGLATIRDLAGALLGVRTLLGTAEIRIRSEIVSSRTAEASTGLDFLNSFIADDLEMVAKRVRQGDIGTTLHAYLTANEGLNRQDRIDIRNDLDAVLSATAPAKAPLGRWPSTLDQPLVLSQQLAVNTALAMPRESSGLLAVNGPPGTGKTTMLRDLMAALIVERATRLSELSHPADAFTGTLRWSTNGYRRTVPRWRPELTGFEMVVTSANNGAVENITNEIPALDAIDRRWHQEATNVGYFADIAARTINAGNETGAAEIEAWALLAARLGNKKNRSSFVNAFWWPSKVEQGEPLPGIEAQLREYEAATPEHDWKAAVANFRAARLRSLRFRQQRQKVYDALSAMPGLQREVEEAATTLANLQAQYSDAQRRTEAARRALIEAEAERDRQLNRRAENRRFRPNLLETVITLGRAYRAWQESDRDLAHRVMAGEGQVEQAHVELTRMRLTAEHAGAALTEKQAAKEAADRDLAKASADLKDVAAALGPAFPSDTWWKDRETRELGTLWIDQSWDRARSEFLLAALRLHKDFLQHVPTQMRQGLQAAMDVVSGSAPRDLPAKSALAAWQTLFFVVPVVSTTFASFARLFSHLDQESLGWLFIDEAGQATPQAAVGALWRSQHAVVVGDPLQLEPVTSIPHRAEQAIRQEYDVDEQWLTGRTSVQRVADRLNRLGTYLHETDGMIWVGSPLTVHRRCDAPMFDIANTIAYDGLMIDGTPVAKSAEFRAAHSALPESKWIDVPSDNAQGHWIPAEGAVLERILLKLRGLGVDMSKVMIIAPFRDVARRVRQIAPRETVAGTVHTAQGKQADIVILILGSDPNSVGARRWAASKPNLLNVAVSRAKRRLYVIGDHAAWAPQRHFDVMARALPRADPRPQD